MNHKKIGLLIAGGIFCFGAGAGIERLRQTFETIRTEMPTEALDRQPAPPRPQKARTVVLKDPEAAREAATLRNRVAELEKALAARTHERVNLQPGQPTNSASPSRLSRREEFRRRMEQLKKENPEQYAEMEKRRAEMRERMEQDKQDRENFLTSLNTQNMTEAQKANHEKLLETLAKLETLRTQREQTDINSNPTAESEFHQQMHQTMDELGVLYQQERTYLLEQAAYAAGYEGDDAATFVDYIQDAYNSTSMFGRRGGGPGGPGGGPPPQ